jgi:hypothetical protein
VLILPLEELDELILLQLPAAVCVDFVHQILSFLLIYLHLAGLEHLHDLVFGHATGIISIELHENA